MTRSWQWSLALLLAAGAWFAAGGLGLLPGDGGRGEADMAGRPQAQGEAAPFAVEVMVAQRVAWRPRLEFSARTESPQVLQVRARAGGEVVETPAREGGRVRRGDLLCRLDETAERAELAAARAALASAERDAAAARRLFAGGNMPEAQLKQVLARLEQARAALRRAQLALRWREIRSPLDAVLQRQLAKVGDVLAPGMPCAQLVVLDPLKVVADVSELEVGQLREGMAVQALLPAAVRLSGRLTYIAPAADVATRTFRIEATVDNPRHVARAGMSARLAVSLPPQPVVRLPLSALVLADDGRLGVRVATADGVVRFVPLRIVREGREAVLAEGLDDGARVIVAGQHFVVEGQKVRAVVRMAQGAAP